MGDEPDEAPRAAGHACHLERVEKHVGALVLGDTPPDDHPAARSPSVKYAPLAQMRRSALPLVTMALFVLSPACVSSAVTEFCSAAPSTLTASGRAGSPRRLTVHGERFLACRDTKRGSPLVAIRTVPLGLTQAGHRVSLGTVDAHGPVGAFTVTVPVPTEFHSGPAIVTAGPHAAPVTLP